MTKMTNNFLKENMRGDSTNEEYPLVQRGYIG